MVKIKGKFVLIKLKTYFEDNLVGDWNTVSF